MMHHPNMHHQPMSGHPPQHMAGHQGLAAHHQMPPPHQMHRDNRVAMGPTQTGNGIPAHGQPIGGMGTMVPPHHGQRPHTIRPMHHPQHHNVPPQAMKPMRRTYNMNGGYPPALYQPPPVPPVPAPDRQTPASGSSAPPPAQSPGAPTSPAAPADAPALANSKEKTPMCLVNELARYNKIKHQYRLTSEMGPAHKKIFTVTLRLGDTEEYTAEGSSIKRAQHAAAAAALGGTRYPAPPPRHAPASPHAAARLHGTVMPTVELNALAMKLCQPAVYTCVPATTAAAGAGGAAGAGAGGRGRARAAPLAPALALPPRLPPPFLPFRPQPGLVYRVRVTVGGRSWLGSGVTPQAARHDAAARALHDLRTSAELAERQDATEADAAENGADLLNTEVKSPVSLVHELALKRNMTVTFSVKSERGPPHMRVFVTTCTVGEMETEGEGNGKKVSKRRAAERMLEEMRARWPAAALRPRPLAATAAAAAARRKPAPAKKKPRNLIKENGDSGTSANAAPTPTAAEGSKAGAGAGATGGAGGGEGADNPISRLGALRHALGARAPHYALVEERGAPRRRVFVVRCDAPPHAAAGSGPNKKAAKRRAAHNVLVQMQLATPEDDETTPTSGGDTPPGPAPTAAAVVSAPVATPVADVANNNNNNNNNDTKRKESESASSERQPVPGVLLMDYHQPQTQPQTVNGVSDSSPGSGGTGAAEQLTYLSQLLGFTVQYSDFPKRNHGSYLSLVSVSTRPPVMCHGAGASTAASHAAAARAALRALAALGLDVPQESSSPTEAALTPNSSEC